MRQRSVNTTTRPNPGSISAGTGINVLVSGGIQFVADYQENPCRSPREFATRAGIAGGFALIHTAAGLLGAAGGGAAGAELGPPGVIGGAVAGNLAGSTLSMALFEDVPMPFGDGRSAKGTILHIVSPSEHSNQP